MEEIPFADIVMEVIAKCVDTWRNGDKAKSEKTIEYIGRAIGAYLALKHDQDQT